MPSSFIEDGNPLSLKVPEELFSYDDFKLESKFRIFDVRSLPEYMGATPFGSSRGGHIPGAKWIPWNSFFDGSGKVLDTRKKEIVSKMGGIRPLVYCTAGYRSALVFAVLLEWGLEPINYDGSWYEYSQRSSPTH
ncbi:hypothetical protein HOF92_08935 [bacterium]|nr:hypothetical protein [bacterium]